LIRLASKSAMLSTICEEQLHTFGQTLLRQQNIKNYILLIKGPHIFLEYEQSIIV
jgi:hypothetical protein